MTKSKPITVGFIPDFSHYLRREFPLEDAYQSAVLIGKLGDMLKALLTICNPMCELQRMGMCKKFEKMSPQADRKFFKKCESIRQLVVWQLYYASFGNNGMGIVIGFDTETRVAHFLALDRHHQIRAFHGKCG